MCKNTSGTLQQIWVCVDRNQKSVQASDFMSDEEGVQELCRQGALWLFGRLVPTVGEASDEEASEGFCVPSEDKIKVRC